ncbi:MAG: YraN family protein [Nitrospira sp.]|jgi:putative endonuclease|nr:YraN family protein [Nitrospira sp.]
MKSLGCKGEDLAITFLKAKGYTIIARNYKTPIGEIDIIAKDGRTIVFIEVKTRRSNSFGLPFESVTKRKRQKLQKLALLFLKKQEVEFPVRFDVVSIVYTDNGKKEIEHIPDAFEM